jgi:uncharacterized membrane protein HdeD (DUF308 family)
MTTASVFDNFVQSRLRPAAGQLFWLGLAMALIGVAALVFPVVSTMAVTLFIGWVLLFTGVVTVAGAFSLHGAGPFFGALLLGVLSIALGLFLAFNPGAGAVTLTLVVGALFAVQAAYEIVFAFEMRPNRGWAAMLVSGIASGVVAAVIITGWPGVSLITLGVLFGVNFITTGLAYIIVSQTVKAAIG